MLSAEDNVLLTRIGPGTPMGALMRHYWIPALPSDRLPGPDCDPVRVRLMGENLVAFRDTQGRVGLLDERCPHRTASLYFGRNEDCGIRCVYHGWKFDIHGDCLDIPSEPAGRGREGRIKAVAYPCIERGGLVWAYMGPPEKRPAFPDLEWALVPDSHRFVTRRVQECNWLQALEGGFDPTHLSFLHKGDLIPGFDFPLPVASEFLPTGAGFVCAYAREMFGQTVWCGETFLMPFHKLIPTELPGAHVWAPIDDETTMLYSIDYNPDAPLTPKQLEAHSSGQLIHAVNEPGSDRTIQNRDNDYLIDRAVQRSGRSYTGIPGVGVQDGAIQESMGPIADRTREHLRPSDAGIVRLRRYLLNAVAEFQETGALPAQDPKAYRQRPIYVFAPLGTGLQPLLPGHDAAVAGSAAWAVAESFASNG